MGRVSVKENKNRYQLAREALALSREKGSELLGCVSADGIEKIENERCLPQPEEVLIMADKYRQPDLCNYYCSRQCPIGLEQVPEIHMKELSGIVLEMLASLNSVNKKRDRLIEIAADGKIASDEISDFVRIQEDARRRHHRRTTVSMFCGGMEEKQAFISSSAALLWRLAQPQSCMERILYAKV